MKLSAALATIKGDEKTASAAAPASPSPSPSPSTKSADAGDRLKQALIEATAPAATKTASQASPVEDLTKLAASLSEAEHEAIVKEAQLYGAAVCDGFMARAAQYKEAAERAAASTPNAPVKTAGAGDDSFEKFAAENQELVKEAAELGYVTTMGQLEKLAQAAYDQGWNQTVQQIHKFATDAFTAGFRDTLTLMENAR